MPTVASIDRPHAGRGQRAWMDRSEVLRPRLGAGNARSFERFVSLVHEFH